MQCPNCGGELDDQLCCPYCGYENEKAAQQRHKKEIATIYDKIAAMLHAPVERTRKILRGLRIGAVVLLCVFSAAFLGALIYAQVAPERDYDQQQNSLQRLEESYLAGDYEKMNQLLDEIDDSYRAVYDKYTIVGDIYEDLSYGQENAARCAQDVKEKNYPGDFLDYPMERLFAVLDRCRELEEKGFVYDEDAQVLAFSQQAREVLQEVLLLTDEEIREGLELQQEDEPDYNALCEISAQRLREEQP